jgi:sucrose phosphorylase
MSKFKPSKFHFHEPNYQPENLEVSPAVKKGLLEKLKILYGEKSAEIYFTELERLIKVYHAYKSPEMIEWEKSFNPADRFSESDIILITYGDLIRDDGHPPLQTLAELCNKYLKGVFNTLHILPFFPSSSDRGFAVMDFTEVDPALGNWEDIIALKDDFKLMFDGVFNHVSSKSRWFQEFLNQNPKYLDFFTIFSTSDKIPSDYLKLLVRPRTTDVLTAFNTLAGRKFVWTTFSQDQIDLNFSNPEVLLKMIEILLFYVAKGADLIRLDAVTYLWDELGTSGVHLSQTHTIVKLFRDVLNAVAPHVGLITETNVPHDDNIKYFGDGMDEAQMVYNFALPPLVLHSFQTGNTRKLSEWARNLPKVSDSATFFNFLDSHDGIGITAVKNILTTEEIEMMALQVIENGGFISYRSETDGGQSPYELNITWYSAINSPNKKENDEIQVKRYLASRAIALVLRGVPGVYIHGLLGSKNDAEAVIEEEQTRSINRKTLSKRELIRALLDPVTTTYQVSYKLANLIMRRSRQKAFHPNAFQEIIDTGDCFFTVFRSSINGTEHILSIINVTNKNQMFELHQNKLPDSFKKWKDIIHHQELNTSDDLIRIELKSYDIIWLKAIS